MTDAPERTPLSEWWRDAVIAWERGEQPPDGIYGKLAEVAALEQELAEAKERRSEAERMGETWLRQRQPEKYGPNRAKHEGEE